MYIATLSGKESLQSFGVAIAIFSARGYIIRRHNRDYKGVCCLGHIYDKNLQLWGLGLVLALNRKDL